MNYYKKQQGASMPVVALFLALLMIVLTIAFKLYPAFYENWQLRHVLESFEQELDLAEITPRELQARFDKRLLTNNVRDFNSKENLAVIKEDGVLSIFIDYEVRVPIYENIDAIVSFSESFEKQL